MITNSTIGICGRLGNQLFQYAALRSLSEEKGYKVKIPSQDGRIHDGQLSMLRMFNISAEDITKSELASLNNRYNEPDHMIFDSNFFSISDNSDIQGFFQSTLYFGKHTGKIVDELIPLEKHRTKGKEYVDSARGNGKIISLHLRRGNLVDPSVGCQQLYSMYGLGNVLDPRSTYGSYILKALEHFNDEYRFLIFTGGSYKGDINADDIEWCKRSFTSDRFLFSEDTSTIDDFCRIMHCDGHILSPVSSFGWWAAFVSFTKDQTKPVVAPLRYHPDVPRFTYRKGFYPKEYILI